MAKNDPWAEFRPKETAPEVKDPWAEFRAAPQEAEQDPWGEFKQAPKVDQWAEFRTPMPEEPTSGKQRGLGNRIEHRVPAAEFASGGRNKKSLEASQQSPVEKGYPQRDLLGPLPEPSKGEYKGKITGEMSPVEQSGVERFVTDPFMQGLQNARKGIAIARAEFGGYGDEGSDDYNARLSARLKHLDRVGQSYGMSVEDQDALVKIADADSLLEALSATWENPASIAQVFMSSLGTYGPTIPAMMVGSTFGPAGTATGAGLASLATEFSQSMLDGMRDRGYDPSDPNSWSTVLSDPEAMSDIRERATTRGVAVGAFDALTGGLAGKLLIGAKPTLSSKAARLAGELGLQAGGGAAGEYTAQKLTGENRPGEVFLEAVAELPTATVEIPSNIRYMKGVDERQQVGEAIKWLNENQPDVSAALREEFNPTHSSDPVEIARADQLLKQDVWAQLLIDGENETLKNISAEDFGPITLLSDISPSQRSLEGYPGRRTTGAKELGTLSLTDQELTQFDAPTARKWITRAQFLPGMTQDFQQFIDWIAQRIGNETDEEIDPLALYDTIHAEYNQAYDHAQTIREIADNDPFYPAERVPAAEASLKSITQILELLTQEIFPEKTGIPRQNLLDTLEPGKVKSIGASFESLKARNRGDLKTFNERKRQQNFVQNTLQHLVNKLAPDMKLAIANWNLHGPASKSAGAHAGFDFSDPSDPKHFISWNPEAVQQLAQEQGVSDKSILLELLSHEFGHALSFHLFHKAPPHVKKALLNDYRRWLRKIPLLGSGKQFWQQRNTYLLSQVLEGENILWVNNKDYWLSFSEFIADQTAKALINSPDFWSDTSKPVLLETAKTYEALRQEILKTATGREKDRLARAYDSVESYIRLTQFQTLAQAQAPQKVHNTTAFADDTTAPVEVMKTLAAKLNLPPEHKKKAENIGKGVAKFNSFFKWILTLPQLERENAHIPGVSRFVEGVRSWWGYKGQWTDMANETIKFARKVKLEQRKEDLKAFEKFAIEVTIKSSDEGRRLTDAELQQIGRNVGLKDNGWQVWQRMDKDFQMALRELFSVLRADAQLRLADDFIAMDKEIKKLAKEEQELLNQNYFPLTRFGRYGVKVIATEATTFEGKDYKKGDVIYFSLNESKKDRNKDLGEMRRKFSGHIVKSVYMRDEEFSAINLPESLINRFEELALEEFHTANPEASPEDLAKFRKDLYTKFQAARLQATPASSFKRRMQRRKGTPGFTMDALRSYSSYFQNFANFISRVKHSQEMRAGLDDLGRFASLQAETLSPEDSDKNFRLLEYFEKHYNYLMNPGNELAQIRSIGAIWYLGFNIRSALVNLTQVPLATYPQLAGTYGDVTAIKEMTKALKDIRSTWKRGREGLLEPDLIEALEWGFESGFLNESLAVELGAYAEGSNMSRMLPGWLTSNREVNHNLRQFQSKSMWMFQQAEKVNRLITFTAAYRAEKSKILGDRKVSDLTPEEFNEMQDAAKVRARETVELTQGEYARWARPKAMQGAKSIFLLFKMYPQMMGYFLFKGASPMRFLAMNLVLAGVTGLPFADDLKRLVEAILQGFSPNRRRNLEVEARKEIMELLDGLDAAPDLLLKGSGSYGFGALYPFDLSASLSLGQMVPGTEYLTRTPGRTPSTQEMLGQGMEIAGGPMVSAVSDMLRAVASDEMDDWKRWERAMPKALSALSKATRIGVRGEETGYKNESIMKFDVTDPGEAIEVMGMAAGLTPRRLTHETEKRWAQKEASRFYDARRSLLLDQLYEARASGDREVLKDIDKAIKRYNAEKPKFVKDITNRDTSKSQRQRENDKRKLEMGHPVSRKDYGIFKDVAEAFPGSEPVEEDSP